jgi:hypothetical protein
MIDPRWLTTLHKFEGNKVIQPSFAAEVMGYSNMANGAEKVLSRKYKLAAALGGVVGFTTLIAYFLAM